ncbi:MAG: DnaA N-terminal domain-containing protein [Chloroflexota bacterium]
MEAKSARDIWETALGELELEVSKPNYRTWLEKTQGVIYQGEEFVIAVPNTFVAEYLDRNRAPLSRRL